MKHFFRKIILLAENGGYRKHLKYFPLAKLRNPDNFFNNIFWIKKWEFILDVNFTLSILKGLFKCLLSVIK